MPLLLAALSVVAWAPAMGLFLVNMTTATAPLVTDIVRVSLWNVLLLTALAAATGRWDALAMRRDPLVWTVGVMAVLAIVFTIPGIGLVLPIGKADVGALTRLGLIVLGLVLIENVYAAARANSDTIWRLKYLLVGTGMVFAYDLFFQAEALLFGTLDYATVQARPLVIICAAPFLLVAAARIRSWSFHVGVGREFVLHTTTLVGSGIYLVGVAFIGYLLRNTGLTWGPLLQFLFIIAAGAILASLLLSGQLRAHAREYITRNFYQHRYDYRREWLRFIRTLSGADEPQGEEQSLQVRVIRALADVVDCTGGALYLRGSGEAYVQTSNWWWNDLRGLISLPKPLTALCDGDRVVVDLSADLTDATRTELEGWRDLTDQAWLLVPLRTSAGATIGAVLLGKPRARRALDWEDRGLFEVLSPQIASYLSEEILTRRLSEAEGFERISKNFSFVAHDLKNLASQLSLVVQQAAKHGNNPEFQRDAMDTVRESVEKMRTTLARLKEKSGYAQVATAVDISLILRQVAAAKHLAFARLEIGRIDEDLRCDVDPNAFQAVLENLLQNAHDATGDTAEIRLTARRAEGHAICTVEDDGPGMTPDFIESELFRPFRSTKSGGFGIGMYQSRDLVQQWGGRLEVTSNPGAGTRVDIWLPLANAGIGPAWQGGRLAS